MTVSKNTKMLLGVAVLAGVGYYLWKKSQKPKAFANAAGGRCPAGQAYVGGRCRPSDPFASRTVSRSK